MRIHFIGIGGIGVSALAQYYLQKGHEISGSDLAQSELTDALVKKGIDVVIGNSAKHVNAGTDRVIYSPAVKPDNPEYQEAQRLGIELKSYPQALGELTRDYKTIAVSGSHGKSTTTAMLALVLIKAGIDPTVIVGTKLKEFNNSNFWMGASKYLVIEACEYDGSFLEYSPSIAVITNIDKEHLDYFKTFANVIKEFKKFIMRLPANGFLVANKEDKNLVKIADSFSLLRGAKRRGNPGWVAQSSRLPLLRARNDDGGFSVNYFSTKNKEALRLKKILKVPGKHNISNALAVLAVARILNIKDSLTFKALSEFKGTWRRFEIKDGIANGKKIIVVNDYAHHPTEILATLTAAREKYPKKKIWCIFQPHQYQRTFYLLKDFVALFKKIPIDQIIITDIYDVAGREEKNINAKVSSEILVEKILRPGSGQVSKKNVKYMSLTDAEKFVKENIKNGEVLVIMGAGDIYKLSDKF